jgi:phenylpropionate dioxygenase-like ring-hydroxylating dioxygenase large terminal subunit
MQVVVDLPYDASYLAENLLDPAHIPVSHHATEGGGNRKNARPLNFEVSCSALP